KGPRLTTEISIAGRYMILIPFSDKVSISQKIEDPEEQKRLKQLKVILLQVAMKRVFLIR
ncbi:MAG TPA: hypothetical protein EYQ87_06415, partial [Candidatus Nitrosopelagicus sp.]|nr:hypothetical protein [Candidatus Nitrosopelagicus sp.]